MSSSYDRAITVFSPDGHLFQVEYAIQAVKLGSTAVGIRTAEGVVLAVEKRLTSPLLNADSVEKIMEVPQVVEKIVEVEKLVEVPVLRPLSSRHSRFCDSHVGKGSKKAGQSSSPGSFIS